MAELGELKKGNEIGKSFYQWYIWVKCKQCGGERWTAKFTYEKDNYTGLCLSCLAKVRYHLRAKKWRSCDHPNWKGGRVATKEGYVLIKLERDDFFFPMCLRKGYVFEHRLVMARHLNRCLLTWEVVHHKNSIRDDNRLENLELLPADYHHYALTRMANYIKKLEREIKRLRDLEKMKRLRGKK